MDKEIDCSNRIIVVIFYKRFEDYEMILNNIK